MNSPATALPIRNSNARAAAGRVRTWLQPQVSIGAREQRDQAILLIAVAVVVTPHFGHLPVWSWIAITGMWIWRAWLTQSLKPGPGRITMLAMLVVCTGWVWLEHRTLFGRDAGVNFLLVLIGLKVLEMRAHRDVLVIVFLSLFVLQTQFLYDQTFPTAIIMVVSVALLFFVLLSVNLTEGDISLRGKTRYLGRVFLLAVPLTLALFFLFPRLPTPVWRNIGGEQVAGTGLSDTMAPGSISRLLHNDSIALRAKFDRRLPAQRELYWRGPVFGIFDGLKWSPVVIPPQPDRKLEIETVAASQVDYTVTLEPSQRHELMALEFADRIDNEATATSRLTPTLELQTAAPIVTRRSYRVRSYTVFRTGPMVDDGTLEPWRQLPEGGNPRSRQWAAELVERTRKEPEGLAGSAPLERRLVDAVLGYIRKEPFRYNIDAPALLQNDRVDEFFFDTRVGFCEHFSSSFVFLMRAMGIPARIVTGYQGGEINPVDGYLVVRQSDAHAWAEVWIPDRGWMRVDPTAAVAPERIERTLRDRRADGQLADPSSWSWLHQLRLNGEALENAWNQWILSYSAERQRALVSWMGIKPDLENIAALAAIVICVLLVLLALGSLRKRAVREPTAELVYRMRRKLERAGIEAPETMGLRDLERRLASQLKPECLPETRLLFDAVISVRYGRPRHRIKPLVRALRARVRRWRPVRLAHP